MVSLVETIQMSAGSAMKTGGELEQIQFLLGHVSVQTTEHYLGCKQRLREAVNDNIGLEPIEVAESISSNECRQ